MMNRRKTFSNCTSIYKGVTFSKRDKKWYSQITINNIVKYIDSYDTEEEAASAYDMAAIHYFGEFAHTNFDKELYEQEEIEDFIKKLETPRAFSSQYIGV